MKINVQVDITPEELRRLMGLPDMESFNQEILNKVRERIEEGMEGYDPMNFFQPYMASSVSGMDFFQKWMSAVTGMNGTSKDTDTGKD